MYGDQVSSSDIDRDNEGRAHCQECGRYVKRVKSGSDPAKPVAGAAGGALVGWAVGGPVGALVGGLLGLAAGSIAAGNDSEED